MIDSSSVWHTSKTGVSYLWKYAFDSIAPTQSTWSLRFRMEGHNKQVGWNQYTGLPNLVLTAGISKIHVFSEHTTLSLVVFKY